MTHLVPHTKNRGEAVDVSKTFSTKSRNQVVSNTSQTNPMGHLSVFLTLFIGQILLFQFIYIAKRHLMPGSVIFYEGLEIVAVTALLGVALFCFFIYRHTTTSPFVMAHWLPAVLAASMFNYAFVITIPSLLDRSISILIIGATAEAEDKGLTVSELTQRFMDVYVDGSYQINKRIAEQEAGGDMVEVNGRIFLTPKGQFVQATNLTLTRLFNIDQRYVLARKVAPPH